MVVLIAVLGLVVVNALKSSPWGTVTIGLTIPIAMIMGFYMRLAAPGRVLEASAIGSCCSSSRSTRGGGSPSSRRWRDVHAERQDARHARDGVRLRGVGAPVWLLLAPRDYLSAFVKIGVVLALAIGILDRAAAAADARAHAVHRRHRADLRRRALSRSRS
jgi:carbon starvation protein